MWWLRRREAGTGRAKRIRYDVEEQAVVRRLPAVGGAEPHELVVREAVHLLDVREDVRARAERARLSSAVP